MEQQLFNVLINGEILEGFDSDQVKSNIAKAFSIDNDRVEKLFSGNLVIIKKGAKLAVAQKYKTILDEAGAFGKLVYSHDGSEYKSDTRQITCPKCAHEQEEANFCIRCKMSLVRYLKKLALEDAKRKRRQELFVQAV